MPVVISNHPSGDIGPVYEVDITKSGLLIQIMDGDGRGLLISIFAWPGIVEAVAAEERREEAAAQEWIKQHYVEGD